MIIEDGAGDGNSAAVDEFNMLQTDAVVYYRGLWTNRNKSGLFSVSGNVTPSAGKSCFTYIKNEEDDDLIMVRISTRVPAGSTEGIEVVLNDSGTPVGGSGVTVTNRNAGALRTATITGLYGSDITGLSGGSSLGKWWCGNHGGSNVLRWWNGIIVPKNRTFSLYSTTGGINIDFVLVFYYLSLLKRL